MRAPAIDISVIVESFLALEGEESLTRVCPSKENPEALKSR
jgi:hypothetical protein